MRAATRRDEHSADNEPEINDVNRTAYIRAIPDRRDIVSRELLVRRVRAEFAELPCLRLTRAQAQRLFGLRADVCDRILAALVAEHTIHLDVDDRYRMPDDAPLKTPKERSVE